MPEALVEVLPIDFLLVGQLLQCPGSLKGVLFVFLSPVQHQVAYPDPLV